MTEQISFFVPGEPTPQGSMKPITLPGQSWTQLIADNDAELKRWRAKVGELAKLAANLQDWSPRRQDAMHLTCRFLLPMPASRPASIRKQEIALCGVKPDLDKLIRAIGDAFTEYEVLFDDSRIVKGGQVKYEVLDHGLCGAEVVLRVIDLVAERDAMIEVLERRRAHRSLPMSRPRS
jgi:Holliday junction resolvase RusA-like endonuclease